MSGKWAGLASGIPGEAEAPRRHCHAASRRILTLLNLFLPRRSVPVPPRRLWRLRKPIRCPKSVIIPTQGDPPGGPRFLSREWGELKLRTCWCFGWLSLGNLCVYACLTECNTVVSRPGTAGWPRSFIVLALALTGFGIDRFPDVVDCLQEERRPPISLPLSATLARLTRHREQRATRVSPPVIESRPGIFPHGVGFTCAVVLRMPQR